MKHGRSKSVNLFQHLEQTCSRFRRIVVSEGLEERNPRQPLFYFDV